MLTPDLQLLKSLPEMILAELDIVEWDPEIVSRAGAYQTEALLKWSKYHQCLFRH